MDCDAGKIPVMVGYIGQPLSLSLSLAVPLYRGSFDAVLEISAISEWEKEEGLNEAFCTEVGNHVMQTGPAHTVHSNPV
jgi:hypothetical protein